MMIDLSAKFNTFYRECVVLPKENQLKLRQLAEKNIERLKEGLNEYNSENGTDYSIVESCVQGSVAMSTVVQNESNDYDIDVAIVFDESDLIGKGAKATRNMVANALRRKSSMFKEPPVVKTSCIRVLYVNGYHIDFAIYRRKYDEFYRCWRYEHAGGEWTERELKAINDWFKIKNDLSGGKLRKVVRLSKMFCKSREDWNNMPSGLVQTILCQECLATEYDRIDELFYYTMKRIVQRLEASTKVKAPVDNGRDLTPRDIDVKRITNWKNRLKSNLRDLDILHQEDCKENDAIQVWFGFFNHNYWKDQITEEVVLMSSRRNYSICNYIDTEEHIEERFSINPLYTCHISCSISGNGFTKQPLERFQRNVKRYIPPNCTIYCDLISTDCPRPYDIYWKVKNSGPEAQRRNRIRGQIEMRGKSITEPTQFYGNHYIECYIVKNNVCVAIAHVDINIGGGLRFEGF